MIAFALAAALAAAVPKPAAGGTPWTAPQVASLRDDVDALLARASTLRGAHVGLLAVDAATGRVLYARRPDDAFMPASTFKVLTGSAALAKLGPAFAFKTQVTLAGEGRLVLVGGGDALLRASDLDAAAAAVAAAGIGPVSEIDADASHFDREPYPPGWTWDDFPYYYAPVLSAVCLEENVVHVTVTPGAADAAPALGIVPQAALPIVNRALTGAPASVESIDLARDGSAIVLWGRIPQDAQPEHLDAAVPNPETYAVDVFTQALIQHGVAVVPTAQVRVLAQGLPGPTRVLWAHDSAPLARYLADFWYPSDNLIGEMLLKSLGVARGGAPGTSANGAALEAEWLKSIGVDPKGLDISDGSGLSIYDRISPRALVQILQSDWNGPNRDTVLDALPVAGVRGSMRDDLKGTPAEARVFAKTGTRRYARGLAGYVRPLRHGAVTFAFMVDDWLGDDASLQALRARVLSRLVRS